MCVCFYAAICMCVCVCACMCLTMVQHVEKRCRIQQATSHLLVTPMDTRHTHTVSGEYLWHLEKRCVQAHAHAHTHARTHTHSHGSIILTFLLFCTVILLINKMQISTYPVASTLSSFASPDHSELHHHGLVQKQSVLVWLHWGAGWILEESPPAR